MKSFTTAFVLSNLALLVAAQGTQFITGPCTSDSDCAEGCCGFNTGLCAGPVVAQQRDGGCGFGNATPNNNAALALGSTVAAPGVPAAGASASVAASAPATASTAASTSSSGGDATGTQNLGNGNGQQFITGVCSSDADCASGCCGFNTGLCAGAVIAQTRDGGCGFGNTSPNNNAALALGSTVAAPGVSGAASAAPAATTAAAATTPAASSTVADAAGSENVGNGQGKQFITGQCDSDADCASACCASGLCSAVAVAAAKGGCGFVASKKMMMMFFA